VIRLGVGKERNFSRRKFLEILTWSIAAIIGVILSVPIIGYFLDPIFRRTALAWSEVGPIGEINENKPAKLSFISRLQEGYFSTSTQRSVWVIKLGGELKVYSPICPHLGCEYSWSDADREFECPCHASIFGIDGRVLGGPAPRPLDTLNHKMEGNILFVQYENFRAGTPEKVRA
jgi:menaquinol-cytochrome c reductase iron-sulfur subunit